MWIEVKQNEYWALKDENGDDGGDDWEEGGGNR